MILLHQIVSEIPYSQGTEIANFSYDSSVRNNCPAPSIPYLCNCILCKYSSLEINRNKSK